LGLVSLLTFTAFGLVSIREGERRAARVFLLTAISSSFPLFAASFLPSPVPFFALALIAVPAVAITTRCLLPLRRPIEPGGRPSRRLDERDIMFARARLRPGSPEFEAYYRMRPENRSGDDQSRSLPGLLSPDAELAEPVAFAAADAGFRVTEALRDQVDGEVAATRLERDPKVWAKTVKRLARNWGAVDVGVTELDQAHVYTHIGRGTGTWGDEITLDHRWAIAFTVEMDHRAVAHAPKAPVVAESARQYVESAKIAVRPGAGPGGRTVKSVEPETILAYLAARDGFETFIEDGRIWVFPAGDPAIKEFEEVGEPGKYVIRPGAGPLGMTVKASDNETMEAYLRVASR
jgi:hypothetical protein